MSAILGQKFSYDGPAGLCSVIVIKGGRILETRRDGKTFIKTDDPNEAHFSNTKQLRWPSEEAWRATLPAGTVTRPPRAASREELLTHAQGLIRENLDPSRDVQRARDMSEEFGISFQTAWDILDQAWRLPAPAPAPPKASDAEVAARATALFRAHPYVAHRGIDARTLHDEFGIPLNEAEAALRRAQEQFRAPAPAPALLSADETAFYERTVPHKATLLIKKPSAKDEAWEARDRAAYDTADPAPCWGFPTGSVYLWLSVQHGDTMVPVCRDHPTRTLRFLIDGALRTFAEAGIAPTDPLWARVSEENPTLKRVA